MKKNIYLNYGPKSDLDHRLRLIKDAGFDGVFLWYDESIIADLVAKVRALNLDIETFHLPYENCNHLWLDDELGEGYYHNIINGVIAAAKYQVKTVIMHNMSGHNPPPYNEIGLNRIKKILDVCQQYDINLAIENVRDIKYTNYIFDNIKHSYLKMCLDFGHTHAFKYALRDVDFEKYGHLIVCIHISDNNGDGDEHLVPFVGNIDYQAILAKLKHINYQGPLTSEAHWQNLMPEAEFIALVYKALVKLEKIYGGSK